MQRIWKKPELMGPAGYWPQLKTAIEAGADAVYFGLKHFTARAKVGFGLAELPEVMQTLHARGVKGFVTFNTLVFDHELLEAEEALAEIAEAGADAIIVQDVGMAQLARRIAPALVLHGSTQMSVTSAPGAELAKQCGCARVVLGRELSLADIERIAQATDVALEVFVHGALCVSYSGQCFSSEAWGGRSANRGQCAQACRLAYDLIVDGQQRDLGAYRYLLSPGNLYALHQVPELVRIGVTCFKIEGRYKDSEYVALTTQAYRQAIDEAYAGQALSITPAAELDLEQVYPRGLGPYFLTGTNHQQVVHGRAPRHRGLQVGTVMRVLPDSVHVNTVQAIKRGDGLVFDAAAWRSPDEPEEGVVSTAYKRCAVLSWASNLAGTMSIFHASGWETWCGAASIRRCQSASSAGRLRLAQSTLGQCPLWSQHTSEHPYSSWPARRTVCRPRPPARCGSYQ